MAQEATPTAPAIPVEEIQTQITAAVSGLIDVIIAVLPVLLIIFATIIGLYLVLRLVSRVARGR